MAKKKTPPPSKPPGRKRQQTEKGKAQKKKLGKKKADDSSDDSEDEVDELEASSATAIAVDWKNPELSQKLLAKIAESKEIKQALYPPCGPNAATKDGGGQKKVFALWRLANELLGDDDRYKAALAAAAAGTAKDRAAWANKIKGRLRAMARTTQKYTQEMGETGAGIDNADEIDMSVSNPFTNKWAKISDACPWYFDMRNLIAQRPNLVPTGLGDSGTEVDISVIMSGVSTTTATDDAPREEEEDDEDDAGTPISNWNPDDSPRASSEPTRKRSFSEIDDEIARGSGDDYNPSSPPRSEPMLDKTADVDENPEDKKKTHQRKNPPKPNTSTPALPTSTTTSKPSKKTKLAEFSELAKQEEKSRHKELELAALRTRHAIKSTEVKGRLGEKREDRRMEERKGKQEERMQKLRMKELKLRQNHELRMRAASSSQSHAASFFDGTSSSGSRYASSSASGTDYQFDGFNGNAMAGPSTPAFDANSTNSNTGDFDDGMSMGGFSLSGNHFG
ncbi:hypothetical protein C8R43DRAFT_1115935 [Mycena crocata]|nr:hypothetical protein C8R43DRAFT_1115935 [Mycena crocata]